MNAESNAALQIMICETKHEIQGVVSTPPPLVADVTKKLGSPRVKRHKLYHSIEGMLLTYGAESWCMKKEDERRLLVAEMGWLRGLLNRSRREKIRNEVTREELGQKETV